MQISFQLSEVTIGWADHAGTPGELVRLTNAAVVGPDEAQDVQRYLQLLQRSILSDIPKLPPPHHIATLFVILNPDLSGIAFVNELQLDLQARTSRAVEKGPASPDDIASLEDAVLPFEVPDNAAVIVLLSEQWLRSVYFDLGPLTSPSVPRIGRLGQILAAQVSMLWGIGKPSRMPERTQIDEMADGFQQLRQLLEAEHDSESTYQELFKRHAWMFGIGVYSRFNRHTPFDDKNIPDFTLRRCADDMDDVVELKQPFLKVFTGKDEPSAAFQAAWHQAERYLTFAAENVDYLRREKGINIENPRCWLLMGRSWTPSQAKQIRIKETQNPKIRILTYDQLLLQAQLVLSRVRSAALVSNRSLQIAGEDNLVKPVPLRNADSEPASDEGK